MSPRSARGRKLLVSPLLTRFSFPLLVFVSIFPRLEVLLSLISFIVSCSLPHLFAFFRLRELVDKIINSLFERIKISVEMIQRRVSRNIARPLQTMVFTHVVVKRIMPRCVVCLIEIRQI